MTIAIGASKTPTAATASSLVLVCAAAGASMAALGIYLLQDQRQKRTTIRKTSDDDSSRDNDRKDRSLPVQEIQCNLNGQSTKQQEEELVRILSRNSITIVHGSVTGTCRQMANDLLDHCRRQFPQRRVQLASIPEFDWWDELINDDSDESSNYTKRQPLPLLLVLLPTYTEGSWTSPSVPLQSALQELETDWRIAKYPLKGKLQVGILGVGSSAYDEGTMGRPAREAVRQFQKLGAKCVVRLKVGDSAVGTHAWDTYQDWIQTLVQQLQKPPRKSQKDALQPQPKSLSNDKDTASGACGCHSNSDNQNNESGDGCCQTSTEKHDENMDKGMVDRRIHSSDYDADEDNDDDYYESDQEQGEPEIMDLEDMGEAMLRSGKRGDQKSGEPKEMVTPSQAAALKKEGYKLIGTHSAVKLCRWTKHQLRGRGGCYKHTFYGITSYQCMEATPSLACANKCVFCWRHHKNPVGKEWRWKTDDPEFIVEQAVQTHVKMIQEARGIPGVRMDRWRQAHTVRHCALSLVGEPIMYPRIHELLGSLHHRHISTFLVTNGQHPAAIETLRPITQLYVSVDAPTKQSLIEIDRPLFRDAWERLRESLAHLKRKGQRTVARLTVVKGWNSDELNGYAQLIALGHVSLVEVKGVTFCGKSDASNLNMSNTPWHHEVVKLTQQLQRELQKLRQEQLQATPDSEDVVPEYGLACEHQHSCSVLLARVDEFADTDPVTGQVVQWNTWIDYDKFHELAKRQAKDPDSPSSSFSVRDYTAPTPPWALFGGKEHGFDPTETRYRKRHKHPKYTQFDARGVPTHDHNQQPLPMAERDRLAILMEEKLRELGGGEDGVETVTTEFPDGAKFINDPRNMFRGMVVTKDDDSRETNRWGQILPGAPTM